MKLYEALAGFKFIANVNLVVARQIRFPRSKRRRIRRKWARRPENNEFVPSPNVIFCATSKTVIAHPATLIVLRMKIAESRRLHESAQAGSTSPASFPSRPNCFDEP